MVRSPDRQYSFDSMVTLNLIKEPYFIKDEYSASLSLISTTGIISLSSMGCFPGLRDNALGTAGAVVALTLGASIVDRKWVGVDDREVVVVMDDDDRGVVVPVVEVLPLAVIAEIIDDPESTRLVFAATGRPLNNECQ